MPLKVYKTVSSKVYEKWFEPNATKSGEGTNTSTNQDTHIFDLERH